MALNPAGIIINGFDAVEQGPAMEAAKAAGIPMVSWHAAPAVGPVADVGVFANVTTDPQQVSKAAADYAYIDAKATYTDLADGKLFGERAYNTSSSAWAGVFAKMTPQQVDAIASKVFEAMAAAH